MDSTNKINIYNTIRNSIEKVFNCFKCLIYKLHFVTLQCGIVYIVLYSLNFIKSAIYWHFLERIWLVISNVWILIVLDWVQVLWFFRKEELKYLTRTRDFVTVERNSSSFPSPNYFVVNGAFLHLTLVLPNLILGFCFCARSLNHIYDFQSLQLGLLI